MSIHKELSYDRDIATVTGVQFSLRSPEEILARSVVEVKKTDTYSVNEPVLGGIFDARMGVIEPNKQCKTCKHTNTLCPGHEGHIVLARPVFQIHFFRPTVKVMKCICLNCSKLLINRDILLAKRIVTRRMTNQRRFANISSLITKTKISKCEECKSEVPAKINHHVKGVVQVTWGPEKVHEMYADEVLPILKRISAEDAEMMGFNDKYNRPEWMICTVFPVPPPAVRPSVRYDTGQRLEDDLTHQLCNIIKKNNMLKAKMEGEGTKDQIDIRTQLLQSDIFVFIDNNVQGLPKATQRNGRPYKTLLERLKTKEGRVRGNLMGKRVDFSARSVITPDPNIGIDEIGVPYKVAMNLTFPEVVNVFNIDHLKKIVENGPHVYPGAKYVKSHMTGVTKLIRDKNKGEIRLELGDTIHRHMLDGDIILFNRQPSLHRMSMMAHKVKVMDYNTFRLNVCVTKAYNADKLQCQR